jgi:hypothetical protein
VRQRPRSIFATSRSACAATMGARYLCLGLGLFDEGEAASTEVVPPSSGRLCGEVETVLLACIQAFLQFSQGIMRQLVAEAAFRDMRIGKTCR